MYVQKSAVRDRPVGEEMSDDVDASADGSHHERRVTVTHCRSRDQIDRTMEALTSTDVDIERAVLRQLEDALLVEVRHILHGDHDGEGLVHVP